MFNISNKGLNNLNIISFIMFIYSSQKYGLVDFIIEIIAVFSGIISVWFAKKENILLYLWEQ